MQSTDCTLACGVCALPTVNLFTFVNAKRRRGPSPLPGTLDYYCPIIPSRPPTPPPRCDASTITTVANTATGQPATIFEPICDLDHSSFMPMTSFEFATWRQGLPYALAKAAVVTPKKLEALEGAWELARLAFESTGANSLQFISFIESVRPYEFNLLAHAALGVERHRLVESCMRAPPPGDASMLTELAGRMTARILMSMTGTSSQLEREDGDARNPTYMRNRFNGSMMYVPHRISSIPAPLHTLAPHTPCPQARNLYPPLARAEAAALAADASRHRGPCCRERLRAHTVPPLFPDRAK